MLNIVHSDGRKYSLERDVLYVFPEIVEKAAHSLDREAWSSDQADYAAFAGIQPAALGPAGAALGRVVGVAAQIPHTPTSLIEVCRQSGFDILPQAVAVAMFASVGHWFVSAHHHFVREALKRREMADGLADAAEEAARAAWVLERGKKKAAAGVGSNPRQAGTGAKYAATRDIIYLFLDAAAEAAGELAGGWPLALAPYAAHHDLTNADLAPAALGLVGLAETATAEPGKDPNHAWAKAGLDRVKAPVRLAVFATLGYELIWAYHEHASATVAAGGGTP